MHMVVRPCGMVLVSRLHMTFLVSVMNAVLLVLLSLVQRHACLCANLERNMSRQCLFFAHER